MGKKDRYEKVYTRNAEVFADIVNYLLYEGEEKIRPDDLRELDGEELLVEELVDTVIADATIGDVIKGNFGDTGKDIRKGITDPKAASVAKADFVTTKTNSGENAEPVTKKQGRTDVTRNIKETNVLQRLRDVVKQVTVRQNEEAIYMIIGLENQTQVHYAMPVRTMVYDAMRYAGQVEAIRKQNGRRWKQKYQDQQVGQGEQDIRKKQEKWNNGDNSGEQAGNRVEDRIPTSAEFLSGITKEDKLLPVITIVILYSSEPWDGPTSLYDMLATKDPEILKYVQDYHIHLIAPGNMTDQQIRCFHSSMRKVLTFIKYAKDKEKMKEIMSEEDSDFYHVDRETAQFIKEMTGVNIEIQEEEEDVNMCKAWEDMAIDMKNEGLQLGERLGMQENRFLVIKNMLQRGYSDEDILAIAECEPEDIEQVRKQL